MSQYLTQGLIALYLFWVFNLLRLHYLRQPGCDSPYVSRANHANTSNFGSPKQVRMLSNSIGAKWLKVTL
jgi:hypothetical protein